MAKADLVPTDYNLLDDYRSFAELEAACEQVAASFNARPHAVTRRAPAELLVVEREALHRIPDAPYTAAFGESRMVGWSATVSYRGAVPGETQWPSAGTSHRPRGLLMAASGEIGMAVDMRAGRNWGEGRNSLSVRPSREPPDGGRSLTSSRIHPASGAIQGRPGDPPNCPLTCANDKRGLRWTPNLQFGKLVIRPAG